VTSVCGSRQSKQQTGASLAVSLSLRQTDWESQKNLVQLSEEDSEHSLACLSPSQDRAPGTVRRTRSVAAHRWLSSNVHWKLTFIPNVFINVAVSLLLFHHAS